jgi:hypothetical protein
MIVMNKTVLADLIDLLLLDELRGASRQLGISSREGPDY